MAGSQFGRHAISEARFEITGRAPLWILSVEGIFAAVVDGDHVVVFWFDPPEVSSQVTIAVTTILTIIALALAISLTLPRVPYLTFADGFFLTCYVFAFVTMVE